MGRQADRMAFLALVISFLGVRMYASCTYVAQQALRGAWRLAFNVDADVRVGGLRMRKVDSTRAHARMRGERREGKRKE